MDWTKILELLLPAALTLAGIWLALRQYQHAKQYVDAHQLTIEFHTLGITKYEPGIDSPIETVVVALDYKGFEELKGLRVLVVFSDEYFWQLLGKKSLSPGETLGPKTLEIPRKYIPELRLHISWHVPHPSLRSKGLRYQARRVSLDQEIQEWRWHRFEGLRRRLHRPLGRWKTVNIPAYDARNFPGWPTGKPAKTTTWDATN